MRRKTNGNETNSLARHRAQPPPPLRLPTAVVAVSFGQPSGVMEGVDERVAWLGRRVCAALNVSDDDWMTLLNADSGGNLAKVTQWLDTDAKRPVLLVRDMRVDGHRGPGGEARSGPAPEEAAGEATTEDPSTLSGTPASAPEEGAPAADVGMHAPLLGRHFQL